MSATIAATTFDEFALNNAIYAQAVAILGLYLWLGLALGQQKLERTVFFLMQEEMREEEMKAHGIEPLGERVPVTRWDSLSMEEKWRYRYLGKLMNMWSVVPGIMVLAGGFVWYHAEVELGWTGLEFAWTRALIVILLVGFAYYIANYLLQRRLMRGTAANMRKKKKE